ncbi:prestin isoform X2 [Osmia lignaria lignaria]|uniref:prestin isoform X2 n=1 Tax=Osmia lignaria lignaria TaxID=1437193 RepID=UPI00402B21F3
MEKEDIFLQVSLERPVYEQEALNRDYQYEKPKTPVFQNAINNIKSTNWKSYFMSAIPTISWLKKYRWKENIISDIISGLTVAIMHIPQGMAYALLGNVPPVVGIYMAFFPVLVYFFFGTSRHVSMGTFAVVCLMTGKTVTTYSVSHNEIINPNATNATSDHPEEYLYTPIQVATAVTLMVGIYQIVMYIFHLGIISTLLSEPLVNSFTTGAAVYVLTSQIKDLLGLKIPRQKGYFQLIFTLIDIFKDIQNTNLAAVIVSLITIIVLVCNNEFLKPWASKKCSIPIPIELIAVVSGTLISKYFYLSEKYSIRDVGDIPTGLPTPQIPTFELLHLVAIDSIAITMVSYTITISMALIFAQKLNYKIDSNQELLAMVALKGMFQQANQLMKFWKLSKYDAIIWIVTFLIVVIVSIDIGLLSGIILSLGIILLQSLRPYTCLLGHIPNTDLYLDSSRFKTAVEIPGLKIFHYCGTLNFANSDYFKSELNKLIGINPQKVIEQKAKLKEKGIYMDTQDSEDIQELRCIIMDMSALSYIDSSGVSTLHSTIKDFQQIDVHFYFVNCTSPIFETIKRCDLYLHGKFTLKMFATIQDAKTYFEKEMCLRY